MLQAQALPTSSAATQPGGPEKLTALPAENATRLRNECVKSTTIFENISDNLRCILELVEFPTESKAAAPATTVVRATTYLMIPSAAPEEGERAVQRGEPFTFTLPHCDDIYVADFLASFTMQKQRAGYKLQSTDAFFEVSTCSKKADNAQETSRVLGNEKPLPRVQETPGTTQLIGEEAKKDMDILHIAQYFRLPISEAARRLQVGETWLKQKCRQHNINRWPYRKLRSIEKFMAKIQQSLCEESRDQGANLHRIQSLQSQVTDLKQAIDKISMGQVLIHDSDDESCQFESKSYMTPSDEVTQPSMSASHVMPRGRNPKRTLVFDEPSTTTRMQKTEASKSPPLNGPARSDLEEVKQQLKPIIAKPAPAAEFEWDALFRTFLTPGCSSVSASPFKWHTPKAVKVSAESQNSNPPSAQSCASNAEVMMVHTPVQSPFRKAPKSQITGDTKNMLKSSRLLISPAKAAFLVSPRHGQLLGSPSHVLSCDKPRPDSFLSPNKALYISGSDTSNDVFSLLLCDESLLGDPMPIHMESMMPDLW